VAVVGPAAERSRSNWVGKARFCSKADPNSIRLTGSNALNPGVSNTAPTVKIDRDCLLVVIDGARSAYLGATGAFAGFEM